MIVQKYQNCFYVKQHRKRSEVKDYLISLSSNPTNWAQGNSENSTCHHDRRARIVQDGIYIGSEFHTLEWLSGGGVDVKLCGSRPCVGAWQ